MRVLILGIDGYIGWPLALTLLKQNYQIAGLDDYSRRNRVANQGSNSLTPIASPSDRRIVLRQYSNFIDEVAQFTLGRFPYYGIKNVLKEYQPDCIVHLAEQPSAPWSMHNVGQCTSTQVYNTIGTLHLLWAMYEAAPQAHLVKLGTMGEYGTPECPIPEGYIPNKPCAWVPNKKVGDLLTAKCPMSGLPFPKQPASFYHASKVHDTTNINFACRTWNLRATDIMQGVVFGLSDSYEGSSYCLAPEWLTRFDYDECFGTAINRWCAQAIVGHPLTVYGIGNQIRGWLSLKDSLQCLQIAIDNPPRPGEHRVFNQYENTYRLNDLAMMVVHAAAEHNLYPTIMHIDNPRTELEEHTYSTDNKKLLDLGYDPTTDIEYEVFKLVDILINYKDRVNRKLIMPKIKWDPRSNKN